MALTKKDHEETLARARRKGDRRLEASVLSTLGKIHRNEGDIQKGLEYQREALEIFQSQGDRLGVAHSWRSLAETHQWFLHDKETAIRFQELAVDYAPEGTIKEHFQDELNRMRER